MISVFRICFLLTASLTLLPACSSEKKPPENLIKEDIYIDLLIELQLLSSYQKIIPADSVDIDSLTTVVFEKYSVSEKQFRNSHEYYQLQIKEQKQRIIKAIDRLKMEQVTEEKRDTLTERIEGLKD